MGVCPACAGVLDDERVELKDQLDRVEEAGYISSPCLRKFGGQADRFPFGGHEQLRHSGEPSFELTPPCLFLCEVGGRLVPSNADEFSSADRASFLFRGQAIWGRHVR